MADKQISSLPQAQTVDDASLFVLEQQGVAMKASGAQWKGYAQDAVRQYVTQAHQQAQAAANSATKASQSASNAAQSEQNASESAIEAAESAEKAKEYSGKPPIIQNDTWWTWDAEQGEYLDTGESSRGDVMYATFSVDPETGLLTMHTPDGYTGPVFSIVDGFLEVSISG